MIIDNSQDVAFQFCPAKWYEKYVNKIELDWSKIGEPSTTSFGTRTHEKLEGYYKGLAGIEKDVLDWAPNTPGDEAIELEAQLMLQEYIQHYPGEPEQFLLNDGGTPRPVRIIDVERTFKLRLPDGDDDFYAGKFDLIIQDVNEGTFHIVDHKSEKRGGKNNSPQAWAARYQVSRYLRAAQQLYGENFGSIILNVLTRQSPAGQKPATFRRDRLERTGEQIDEAMENLLHTIGEMKRVIELKDNHRPLPADRENCCKWGYECDYYPIHILGRTEENLAKFRPTEEYLDL